MVMKLILLFTFAMCTPACYAQITEVVQSDLTAKELFVNARETLATVYSDFKKELDDDLGYNIVAYGECKNSIRESESHYTVNNEFSNKTSFFFRVTINCKDNKYRYMIDNITLVQKKKFTKTTSTDMITSFMLNTYTSDTDISHEFDYYRYSEMDSIYRRDSISYYSALNEFNELSKRKNSAKRKERNRIYKDMANVGNVMMDKEKKFRATKSFHERCKNEIRSIMSNIKIGMSNKNDW